MPRHNRRAQSVPESILMPTGGVETILLDERYSPYTRQGARIENLCGSFGEFVPVRGLERVTSRTGTQRELFHLHGNVVVNQASKRKARDDGFWAERGLGRARARSWRRAARTAWPAWRARSACPAPGASCTWPS